MKALMIVGKGLAVLFWLVFGAALAKWLGSPFEQLVHLLAAFLLLLHGLELWLFSGLLVNRANPWLDRLQVLLFGIFHLYGLKVSRRAEAQTAVTGGEAAHA